MRIRRCRSRWCSKRSAALEEPPAALEEPAAIPCHPFGATFAGPNRTWTVKQEFARQSDEQNRVYYEPRCIEGNYGLPGVLHGRRMEERAFAEGRGPDPRTMDNVGGVLSVRQDPLQ